VKPKPITLLGTLLEHPDLAALMPEPEPGGTDEAALAHVVWGLARAGLAAELIDLDAVAPAYEVRGGTTDRGILAGILADARGTAGTRAEAEARIRAAWPLRSGLGWSRSSLGWLETREPLPPREWTLADVRDDGAGFSPRTLAMLTSHGGLGKGWLLMQLGLAAAAGRRWLDRFEPREPLRVLHLTVEDDREEVMRRAHAIVADWSDDDVQAALRRYDVVCSEDMAGRPLYRDDQITPAGDELLGLAAEYDLVIADPLAHALACDENDNGAMTHALADSLLSVAARGPLVIAAHHVRKGGTGPDGHEADASRGASGIVNACRMVWRLDPVAMPASEGSNKRTERSSNGAPKLVPRLDYDSLWLTCVKSNKGRRPRPIPLRRTDAGPLVYRRPPENEQEAWGWRCDDEGNIAPWDEHEGQETDPKAYGRGALPRGFVRAEPL
jgi:hypothetical protein